MRKVAIIFTAATGGGHNQAAEALKYRLEQQNIEVEIVHLLKSCPKVVEGLVENGYTFMATHFSKFYGHLYHLSHNYHINKNLKRLLLKLTKAHMRDVIDTYKPSLLISTHPFFVNPMAQLKKEGVTNAKCMSVITDLGVHRFYLNPAIDAYITGSKHTSKQLVNFGIAQDRIFDFGIPVKDTFFSDTQNHTTPEFIEDGVQPKEDPFNILIMSGSMGSHKIIPYILNLKKVQSPLKIDVICGNNKVLYASLQKHIEKFPEHVTVNLHGFISNVSDYMDRADVLISKPGGLTLTEALYKKLPILMPFYIEGQESENAQILSDLGVAIDIRKNKSLNVLIERLMAEPLILEKMRYNMMNVSKNYSMDYTGKLASELIA